MFQQQSEYFGTTLSFKPVHIDSLMSAKRHDYDEEKMIEEVFPIFIEADQQRLLQILQNLIKNAIKFTPGGKVSIYFAYDQFQSQLCVHVHDTGVGVAKAELSNMFLQFGKKRRTAEENDEGNGMGLMVCQQLVQQYGGQINAFSKGLGLGTVISFTMKASLKRGAVNGDSPYSALLRSDIGCTNFVADNAQQAQLLPLRTLKNTNLTTVPENSATSAMAKQNLKPDANENEE